MMSELSHLSQRLNIDSDGLSSKSPLDGSHFTLHNLLLPNLFTYILLFLAGHPPMESLPHDIIAEILLNLPAKSLARFKYVEKSWHSLIIHPDFIKKHLHLHQAPHHKIHSLILNDHSLLYSYNTSTGLAVSIDFPLKSRAYQGELWGSCNGLLCIAIKVQTLLLWNPCTREFKKLPTPPIGLTPGPKAFHYRYGFGYDNINHDYKVVRLVVYPSSGYEYRSEVKVYTLGRNTWRSMKDISLDRPYSGITNGKGVKSHGVFLNGVVHWVVYSRFNDSMLISAFNLATGKFEEVPLPDGLNDSFEHNLGILGGCLCITNNVSKDQVELLVMEDYGLRESWTKLFRISNFGIQQSRQLRPLCFYGVGGVLLEEHGGNFILYNSEHGTVTTLKIDRTSTPNVLHVSRPVLETGIYIGSLVSLRSGTYVGERE